MLKTMNCEVVIRITKERVFWGTRGIVLIDCLEEVKTNSWDSNCYQGTGCRP